MNVEQTILFVWFLRADIFYACKYKRMEEWRAEWMGEKCAFRQRKSLTYTWYALSAYLFIMRRWTVHIHHWPHSAHPYVNECSVGFYHLMQHISPNIPMCWWCMSCRRHYLFGLYTYLLFFVLAPNWVTDCAHRRQQIIIYHFCCAVRRYCTVPQSFIFNFQMDKF